MFLKALKNISKNNWPFLMVILLFLAAVGSYLCSFEKFDGHININQFHNKVGDTLFPFITYIGDGVTAIVIILLLFIWRIQYGIIAVLAFGITAGITHGLKYFVYDDVQRPFLAMWGYFHEGNGHLALPMDRMKLANSFPSGHTTSAMSIFCMLALIFNKKWAGIFFAFIAIIASYSRVYLSQHFMEDVFAGTIIGVTGTIIIFALFAKKLEKKYGIEKLSLKRVFDIIASLIVLLMGLPFFLLISMIIMFTSKGGIFFVQQRVGKGNKDFGLFKFRTMKPGSEKLGQITIGGRDPRITKIGYFLRKFKLDEFPQLINILSGDMSIVGPRPEVRKYVDLYNPEQMKVLTAKPGLTDFASIEYIQESELLGKSANPNETYVQEIMPAKLELNLKYIEQQSIGLDLQLIFRTIGKLFR